LLKPGRGIFVPDKFTDRGKWMDGWETRRRRKPGNDWCVIQLGLRGLIRKIDIDTNHFLGNHPPFASVDAVSRSGDFPAGTGVQRVAWKSILKKSALNPGSQNLFDIANDKIWTHVRLNIFPDGGVARLRVYGIVIPDWSKFKPGAVVDLAAIENGGVSLACSDMFFSSMNNLIMPGRGKNMGDGWETKRRRGPGHDWIIVKLGRPGTIRKIEVDTNHFKGNYPDTCSIDGINAPNSSLDKLKKAEWKKILPKTKLQASTRHFFERELRKLDNCTHVRLNIFPDGGVSRLRVWGTIS
jgi:allantoicase